MQPRSMSSLPDSSMSTLLAKLPAELVQRICHHLLEEPTLDSKQPHLKAFQLTCKTVAACARPLIWQDLNIVFDETDLAHDENALQNLQGIAKSSEHPIFTYTRRIRMVLPYYTIVTKCSFTEELDIALSLLLSRSEGLLHVQMDFALVDHTISRLARTINRLFEIQTISSLSVLGLVSERPIATQQASKITQLRIEQIGNSLPINLLHFQHLSQLYLGIDCRDEHLTDHNSLYFPPSLWSTLDVFVLEIYGWEMQTKVVTQAIAMSVKLAKQTRLAKLGIFLNADDQGEETVLETFLEASPDIRYLALVISELPTARTVSDLAERCPDLCELTLCAYLNGGTW